MGYYVFIDVMNRRFPKNRLFVLIQKGITLTLVIGFIFTNVSTILLHKSTFGLPIPEAEAAVVQAVKVESFDQDVTTDGSTFTLSNDVGDVDSAFIRMNTGTRKTSAGPTGSTANTAPDVGTVGLVLTDTDTVTVERVNATEVKVMGEVWRYEGFSGGEHEFIVRDRVAISLIGSSASTPISGISNVDKVVPFVTGYTVNASTVNDWEDATIAAHMDDSGNLVVSRNNSGTDATVYVDVVEFTGSAWSVCYGYSAAHDTSAETVTLNTDSDGQGGSTCDVGDWGTATIIEATMEGDSSETGISDVLALVRPGGNTTSVVFDLVQQDAAARNDGEAWIYVLQNDDLVVNRDANTNISEGNGTYGTATWPSGATTTAALDTLALEWFTDSSGVGTAHMRGGLHARITNPSGTIQHWTHRSGNNVGVEYGVIELAGLTTDNTFYGFDTLVVATSTHIASTDIPSNDVYLGGAFVIREAITSRNVTSILITESGTVDGSTGLSDIELWFDVSTTTPYDCGEHSFDGDETQFGSTDTNGFSGTNGVSSFSGSVQITPSRSLCVYPVVSVTETATDGQAIAISINDATTDVVTTGGGSVGSPSYPQAINGSTVVQNSELTQIHYHWRNDDGSESSATSIDGSEDTVAGGFGPGTQKRLRIEVSAEGSSDANPAQFRLQFAEKSLTCEAATGWEDVADVGGAWDIGDSASLDFADNATNIASQVLGEVTDEELNFNGTSTIVDGGDKSVDIQIDGDEFAELEYTVMATAAASEGTTYCFRVVDESPDVTHAYRLPLTIQATEVTSDVTDFPVYVDMSTLGTHFFANVGSGGGDIRVTAGDGSMEIPREIVSINTGAGTGEMYFKAPNISASVDTTFYIYYGAAGENDYQASSTYGTHNVWSEYEVVYHFEEDPSVSLPQYVDSTGNSSGTSVNMESIDRVPGQAGNAAEVDGVNEHIETDYSGSMLSSTWSIFLNANGTQGACDGVMFSRGTNVSGINYGGCQATNELGYHWNDDGASWGFGGGPIFPTGEWAMAAMVVESAQMTLYSFTDAGVSSGVNAVTHAASTINNLDFGWDSFGDARSYSGVMDEARLSATTRNQAWLETVYSNFASSTDFYATSSPEALSGVPVPVTYDMYPEANIAADIYVTASSSQVATLDVGATNQYIGGTFVVTRDGANRTLADITITATGTVDATLLSNPRLYYDIDSSAPEDCTGESYSGGESSVSGTAFSGPNGTSTFSSINEVLNTNTTFCGYVVFDIDASVPNADTVIMQITNPSTDVIVTGSSVGPSTVVSPAGSTTLAGAILTQTGYHWRNDNDNEADASSATANQQDTPLLDVARNTPYRLRFQIDNQGTVSSQPTQFQLEYGTKISTCELVGSWQAVDVGSAFTMASTSLLIDAANTTDVSTTTNGGIENPVGQTFLSTNGGQKENNDTTGSVSLTSSQFAELEFAIEATDQSGYDTNYCFRLTDAGTPLATYSQYAELITREKQDFFIQRGTATLNGTSLVVNANASYTPPFATSSAFVRITNSHMTGAGDNAGTNGQTPANVTAYISDQSDITSSFTIERSGSVANTRVDWEIIEYIGLPGADNEMIVRDVGQIPFTASTLTQSGPTITDINDDTDVVVFITGQRNQSTSNTEYNDSLFTASWNATTSEPDFTRGDDDVAADVGYAVVEFTGLNWRVQRVEHVYTAAGSTETESITAINSVSRAFVHAQKRVGNGQQSIADGGHRVWLSSIGFVSFELQSGATTPSGHNSVAWVIENTQTGSGAMISRQTSDYLDQPGVSEPLSIMYPIGATINTSNASIWGTSFAAGTGTTYPRLQAAFTIASSTHFEFWQSDTNNDHWFQAEVMEWPVAQLAFEQHYYRFYVDNASTTPNDPWPVGAPNLGENAAITGSDDPLGEGERVRIRMTLQVNNATFPEETLSFKLQYGRRDNPSCSAIETWVDVGAPGSGEVWRGYDALPADGTELPTSLLAADVLATYEEANNTAVNPNFADYDQLVEYDWLIEHNGAIQRSDYCFRMVQSDSTVLAAYHNYPTLRTTGYTPVVGDWRWYNDETNETPVSPLAAENVAPTEIDFNQVIKLRVLATEVESAPGSNVKFRLQYSQDPNFTNGGHFVVASSSCTASSTWCYANGAGSDNQIISTTTLIAADSCNAGVGPGCGTHNESPTTTSSHTQNSLSNMEFEYTLRHAGARAGAVYYFRLYDFATEDPLSASSSYPSLVAASAQLVFTNAGLPAGTATEGVVTDVPTATTSISFGSLPFDTEYEGAYRLTVDTNATEGYQVFMIADHDLQNSYGEAIPRIMGTNASPISWSSGCSGLIACFGYHPGDDSLSGGSARFAPDNSYAALATTTLVEVAYSSVPVTESHDIVFKIEVGQLQAAGQYGTGITFVVVPVY